VPFIPGTPQRGSCPYCMDGELFFDTHSNKIYCGTCNKVIALPEIYTLKTGEIKNDRRSI